jgi:uncharacterized protein
MTTFILAFALLLAVVAAMAVGAIVKGRTIAGSCGGLNAIAGTDRCAVCSRPIDPDNPVGARMACRKARGSAQT